MTRGTVSTWVVLVVLSSSGLIGTPDLSRATSLRGDGSPEKLTQVPKPLNAKQQTVRQYVDACLATPAKQADCDKIRKEAVDILKEDLRTVGSSAKHEDLPRVVKVFQRLDPELRIAAADAIGMMGPTDRDVDLLVPLANDPVPDVRRAVAQAISHGKGSGLSLLGQRVASMKTGMAAEGQPEPGKYGFSLSPDSVYLHYGSDPASGRLSYVTKSEPSGFFKAKAKKGPFTWSAFEEKYRYPLEDERAARQQVQDAKAGELEKIKPDPTNLKALSDYMQQVQAVQMSQLSSIALDSYQPPLFADATVYVLEERQIGERVYPTRYAVVYQDVALKRPGYRLAWMTVPDTALKTAQAASLASEKQEALQQQRDEAGRKRAEELESLVKKKDEEQKKKFKKGQADLEKELGF